MIASEFLEWLEKKGYLSEAKNNSIYMKKIITECLDVKKDEDFLIIGDTGFDKRPIAPIIAGAYYFAASDLGLKPMMAIQDAKLKGDAADEIVVEALRKLNRRNVIAMALSSKLGKLRGMGQSFREFSFDNYHRFASSISLGKLSLEQMPYFIKAINVDYKEMEKKGDHLKRILDNGKEVRIITEAGTDIKINIDRKESINNCGIYKKPREGGNIPAGEVYTPPRWKNVDGTIVVDGSSAQREGTQKIEEPIILEVKNDEIIEIKGGKEAEGLRKTLEWAYNKAKHPWGIKRIGELGIGTNPNAEIVGATIIDEKVYGTAHFGIGSNYWFGGTIYAIIHLDQILKDPKIYVDGKLLKY